MKTLHSDLITDPHYRSRVERFATTIRRGHPADRLGVGRDAYDAFISVLDNLHTGGGWAADEVRVLLEWAAVLGATTWDQAAQLVADITGVPLALCREELTERTGRFGTFTLVRTYVERILDGEFQADIAADLNISARILRRCYYNLGLDETAERDASRFGEMCIDSGLSMRELSRKTGRSTAYVTAQMNRARAVRAELAGLV